MMWAALGLIMLIRFLSAREEELPWSAVSAAMIPYAPMVGLLSGPHAHRVRSVLLASLAVLYPVPFLIAGAHWDWLPWPVAVAVLCAFRGRVGWPLFGLVLVVTFAAGSWSGDDALTALTRTFKTANDGLIVFGLYALAAMVSQLHATRGELARLQVLRERRRLDGQMHTVLGAQLRALGQVLTQAVESVEAEPEAARDRLGAAVATARQAAADVRQAAGDYRSSPPAPPAPIQSPRVAHLTLAAVYLCESLLAIIGALTAYHRSWTLLLLTPLMGAAGAALLLMRPSRRQMVLTALLLGPTAIPLGYLIWELAFLACLWPFLLGLVLTRMRRPLSWTVTGAAVVLYVSIFFYPPPVLSPLGMAASLTSMLILTWVSYSLIRLSELVTVLHRARWDLAREALVREHTRVARDLHDVLSFSLSAIALQGELCRRLLESDPERTREQLAMLPELAGRALAEVESVARGPVALRTDEELVAARTVLESAGVRPTMTVHVDSLPADVDAALAAALREAVTNVVRHSGARTCSITITTADGLVRLRVVNDGVPDSPLPADTPERRGSGLIGMAERTGGRLSARSASGGRFELVAEFAVVPAGTPTGLTAPATGPA